MHKYEVGGPWPHGVPAYEMCTTQIVGSSFDLLAFLDGPKAAEARTFKDAFMRLHVHVVNAIPLIAISYLGSRWTWDVSLCVVGMTEEQAAEFLSSANVVNLFLVDRPKRTIKAIRTIGLPAEAVDRIKDACREQLTRYKTRAEFDAALNHAYQHLTTDDLIRLGWRYEFKGR